MIPALRFFSLVIALTSALAASTWAADSTDPRINDERCAVLRAEHVKLKEHGVVQDMQNGPDWAKANLSQDRLGAIEEFLQLEEELKFACREASLLIDPSKLAEPETKPGDPSAAGEAGATQGQPPVKKKRKSKQQTNGQTLIWPGVTP